MFRYVALLWNRSNCQAAAVANRLARRVQSSSDWTAVRKRDGLTIFAADIGAANRIHAHRNGVVLGTLFHRSSTSVTQVASLEHESAQILETGGKSLTRDYWGRYVSFADDASTDTVWILRDPIGQLPAFQTSFEGVQIYFSDLQDCLQLGLDHWSIDWRYVAAHTVATMVQTGATGLAEVREILPGECVEQGAQSVERHSFWNPFEIARADPIESREQGEQLLYATARRCVGAWAGCYDNILLRLSGGLDSSIVAACLGQRRVGTDVTCFHLFTPDGNCDEREYARSAAGRAGLELVEQRAARRVRLEPMLRAAKCAKPFAYLGPEAGDGSELAARERGAQAIFTGESGDQLFYQHPVTLAAVDYFHDHRVPRHGFSVAWDAAVSDSISIWSVLRQCVRHGWLKRPIDPLAGVYESMALVQPAVIETVRAADPFADSRRPAGGATAPGKMQHIFRLSFANRFYDPMGSLDCPETVNPLKSQPLVEACLRIPTHVLANGGRDRALARQAFSNDLPRSIVERHAKGDADLYAKRIIDQNLSFVREMLLDGLLVRQGFLDRGKLEAVLSTRSSQGPATIGELVHHVATEAWLRSWEQPSQRLITNQASG